MSWDQASSLSALEKLERNLQVFEIEGKKTIHDKSDFPDTWRNAALASPPAMASS